MGVLCAVGVASGERLTQLLSAELAVCFVCCLYIHAV